MKMLEFFIVWHNQAETGNTINTIFLRELGNDAQSQQWRCELKGLKSYPK
jgi:hypothetical protein